MKIRVTIRDDSLVGGRKRCGVWWQTYIVDPRMLCALEACVRQARGRWPGMTSYTAEVLIK